MKKLQQMLDTMEPAEALAKLLPMLKTLLSHLDEEARVQQVLQLLGGAGEDKIGSMVNL